VESIQLRDQYHKTSNLGLSAPLSSSIQFSTTMKPHTFQQADGSTLQEDDTCYLISIEMPGVDGKDISISTEDNTVIIGGSRRTGSTADGRIGKRQRLSRRFDIDLNVVDINRAVANIWNGSLTLYAPKKVSLRSDSRCSRRVLKPTLTDE
jgi:HSP20 family molecular chaperone IbpA